MSQYVNFRRITVLLMLTLAYFINQLARYMLPITTKSIAQELHYGDKACMKNTSLKLPKSVDCGKNGTNKNLCEEVHYNNQTVCEWNYNGQGYDYQLLAGPVFIVVYTLAGIPLGFGADLYNRKLILSVCLIFWSVMTTLTGAIKELWQLYLLRFLVGIGEAGCTPFASSLIADYFPENVRGFAIAVYNLGIYLGYSLSYAIGNSITKANLYGQGWRWAFYISGIPGLVLGVFILIFLREPERQRNEPKSFDSAVLLEKLRGTLRALLKPSILVLFLAGSIRNAGGYVIAVNTQNYFNDNDLTPEYISKYMSWIPLVGGSLGVVLGGIVSDRIVKRRGPYARVFVLVVSQLIAAPFCAGFLFFDFPGAFFSLIPGYIFGEMWVGVCLALVVELVPAQYRSTSVAVYLFVITNIGGNIPLLVPPIRQYFKQQGFTQLQSMRNALYLLYPGCYVVGALLFLLTLFVLKHDLNKVRARHAGSVLEQEGNEKEPLISKERDD